MHWLKILQEWLTSKYLCVCVWQLAQLFLLACCGQMFVGSFAGKKALSCKHFQQYSKLLIDLYDLYVAMFDPSWLSFTFYSSAMQNSIIYRALQLLYRDCSLWQIS